eukprot:6186072-Pleurochrysis_carterae.AAC.2
MHCGRTFKGRRKRQSAEATQLGDAASSVRLSCSILAHIRAHHASRGKQQERARAGKRGSAHRQGRTSSRPRAGSQ